MSNFGFLEKSEPHLHLIASRIERYLEDDPVTAIVKVRQLGEAIAKLTAAQLGIHIEPGMSQVDILSLLGPYRQISLDVKNIFHAIRREGNRAVHEHLGDTSTAVRLLLGARMLCVWYHQSFYDKNFKVPPFQAPPPAAKSSPQVERTSVISENDFLEMKERALKAEQAQAELIENLKALEKRQEEIEKEGQKRSAADQENRLETVKEVSKRVRLSELETRLLIIDKQLQDAGWEADTENITFAKGVRPVKGRNMAIAEWPTENGPVDYALFRGLTPYALVEAKNFETPISSRVSTQTTRYAEGFIMSEGLNRAGGPWGKVQVPFLFATNGRPYLKEIETLSGIWFRDARNPTNLPRAILGWKSPDGLKAEFETNIDEGNSNLSSEPIQFDFDLRYYQVKAIEAFEKAVADGARNILIAMATGTGKTKTAIALMYRALASKRFRRILFLVDRKSLGIQTEESFRSTKMKEFRNFAEIFGISGLGVFDNNARVDIATVQSMVKRVLADDKSIPPVDSYDLIVVDECHRGYILDKEQTDNELEFRDDQDYISKYRRVIEYFDAVKLGLTATPALHTTEIFGTPVYRYPYRTAVTDRYLCDFEAPYIIATELSKSGIRYEKDAVIKRVSTTTGQLIEDKTPDEVVFGLEDFNRKVLTENFNRTVCRELVSNQLLPMEINDGKTIIFCASDVHADLVVQILKEECQAADHILPDNAIVKITAKADKPEKLIRSFKNERDPRIAVTVDLLTTGIDVPQVRNIVFLRRVGSRILYEQMMGRATRLCPEIQKETFRVFDAVGLYESLVDFSTMKPVAVNVKSSFEALFSAFETADTEDGKQEFLKSIVKKIERKYKSLKISDPEALGDIFGEDVESMLKQLQTMSPSDAFDSLKARLHPNGPHVLDCLYSSAREHMLVVSVHPDELVSVTQDFGRTNDPGDYLEQFSEFIQQNVNKVAALKVMVTRPRDLQRKDLLEVVQLLDSEKFTEANLHRAWARAKHEDVAARIIGHIRQAALGEALESLEERIVRGKNAVLKSQAWTPEQKRWIERFAKAIANDLVIDQAALNEGAFKSEGGGITRLDKIFKGELLKVIGDLTDAIWRTGTTG
jgi:type I restriction enzyme R subunit